MARRWTPENRGALLERVSAGVSYQDACRSVGVSYPSLKAWLKKGREGVPVYAEFLEALEGARAEAEARPEPMDEAELLHVVSEAARKGSVAAMKLRWEILLAYREPAEAEEPQADPLEAVDELAARRAA
jgi:hypothetical protein